MGVDLAYPLEMTATVRICEGKNERTGELMQVDALFFSPIKRSCRLKF